MLIEKDLLKMVEVQPIYWRIVYRRHDRSRLANESQDYKIEDADSVQADWGCAHPGMHQHGGG